MRYFQLTACIFAHVIALVAAVVPAPAMAEDGPAPFATKAKQVYMVEDRTGTVLLSSNENQSFPAASLTKLMTMELVFSALERKEITPETTYSVSENAWRTGGAPSGTTTMFAALKSQIAVSDLIRGVIIDNANDACLVLAEGMAPTEADFAARMTARAKDLRLDRSAFSNATGLPPGDNRTTARDMVELARHLYHDYPQYYPLYAQPDFTWNKIFQRNKNPLLSIGMGVDGLGAGYAEGSGFAFVASATRNGTRLFLAMGGLASEKDRLDEAKKALDWGLSSFASRILFRKGEMIGQASVYGGEEGRVDLVAADAIDLYLPVNNPDRLSGRIIYHWPLRAPVAEGQEIGTLRIAAGDRVLREVPLMAAKPVARGGLVDRAEDALLELMFFWL